LSENFAFKNPSFEVFSSNRLTRYDMPGNNSPTGQYSHAITHLDERALDRTGHSVEQLKLEAALVDSELLGVGLRVRDAANVMRTESGRDD
jgi:hypothetical protein